jgi:hypothetical protein
MRDVSSSCPSGGVLERRIVVMVSREAVVPKSDSIGDEATQIRALAAQLSTALTAIIQRARTLQRQNQL